MQSLANPTYNKILQLVRASLYGDDFALNLEETVDWAEVYKELEQQTISCMVVDVLSNLNCEIPSQLYDVWVNRLGLNISSFHRIMSYQDEALKALREEGIPVAVLKGAVSAANYPKPEYRTMGDIDLLVSPERFHEARACLVNRGGYQFMDEAKRELDVRTRQKHVCMNKDGIILELHIRAFHLSDENADQFLNRYMEDGLKDIQWLHLFGYEIPALPMLQNALELLLHVQEHFCGVGIGMRQVIDWMLFVEHYLSDDIYEKELQPILRKVGLEKFACALTRMCQLYLGLPEGHVHWCMDADEMLCGEMLEYIFQQGNFGHKNARDNGARAFSRLRHPLHFLKSIQSVGLSSHPELRDKKVLRYFAWVPQLGRYVGYVFSKDTNLREDYKEGKRRSLLFERLEVFKTQSSEERKIEPYAIATALIVLVRDVLHDKVSEDILEHMEESQVQDIIEYAADQGLLMFLNEHPRFRDYMKQEKQIKKVLSSVYLYTLQTEELKRILDAFEERQISCIILKGSRSRELYPKAELRSMGDIDLLYKPEQTKAVQQAMTSLGYRGNGDTAKHDHYSKKMVTVEMHKALCVPGWKESEYFDTIWNRTQLRDGYSYAYEMTLEDHYLFTFTHLLEHFRMGGIGIRMVLDMYVLSQVDGIDWRYVDEVLEQLGYQEFHSNIRRLAELWFGRKSRTSINRLHGQPASTSQKDGCASPKMLETSNPVDIKALECYIMQGGVFGNTKNDRLNTQLQYSGRAHFLREVIFPSYERMQTVYPWLKCRLLLPVAWAMRCVHAAIGRRANVKSQFNRAKAFGGNRHDLDERKNFFESVGLRL